MERPDVKAIIMNEIKIMCSSRSIEDVQVMEICRRCGISRPTFYAYFRDKYDVLSQIYKKTITDGMAASEKGAPWHVAIGRMFEYVQKDRDFYINAVKYTGQNSLVEMILYHVYTKYAAELARRMGHEPDEEMMFQMRFNSYGGAGSMLDWIRNGMQDDPYIVAERIASCMPAEIRKYFEVV